MYQKISITFIQDNWTPKKLKIFPTSEKIKLTYFNLNKILTNLIPLKTLWSQLVVLQLPDSEFSIQL